MKIEGRNKVKPEFNMSSMTDIVFLLLIFFMLASTLVTTNAIDVLLPSATGKTTNKKSVAVTISKDLTFYIDNNTILERNLELKLLEVLSTEDGQPTITLRAEESVPISKVAFVMDIANRNKLKVILAVKP
jgi:biopolymer transport protein ExbD